MEALFLESHGVLEQINSLFVQLERHVGHQDEIQIEETIQKKIEELNQTFDRLEVYVMKEPPNKRQASRLKLNQLKYDSSHLTASLRSFQKKRYLREKERNDREELLNRRFTTNSEDTSINIDYSLQHHRSLQNANRGVDDLINQGYATLDNLKNQRELLKNTRTRMLNFLNTLGLSNTVMQLIERRAYQDKFVLFGGMMITVCIMFFVYMYFT
ncbi:unnamed protein product [Orchesella dallaii]|uniref:Golgi SNAP receptor complex member 2 n=1 Tax=Orchesella dallaii TaxID=48710 RepID=A0ABP1PS18_9HEXA